MTTDQAASKSATCQIVSIDWLVESAAKKKPIAEKPYLLDAGSTTDAADGADGADDTKQNGKRPTRKAATKAAHKDADDAGCQDANGDDKKAVKKGAKSAAATKTDKKRTIKDEDDDDEADDKATVNKKPKNSQKASSKSLVVPVDENFIYEKPTFKSEWPLQCPCYYYRVIDSSAQILRSTLTNRT